MESHKEDLSLKGNTLGELEQTSSDQEVAFMKTWKLR